MSQSRADTRSWESPGLTSDIRMVTVASQWPGWNHHQPPLTPPDSPPDLPCHDLSDLDIQFTETTMPLQPRRSRRNLARCSTIDLSDIEDSEASRSPRASFRYSGGSVTTVSPDHTHSDAASFDAGDNYHDVEIENPPSPTICLPSGKFLISHKNIQMTLSES